MSDTQIVPAKRSYDTSMDGYLTKVCLLDSMGDVVRNREQSGNVKAFTINSMIFNAVFEMDVELIKTIVNRIDGLVPDEEHREGYANILGDAIEDVLSYPRIDLVKIVPEDPAIIALAKVLVYKATTQAGTNFQARKERNLAASIVLERTGGRKTSPTKPLLETKYVEPDWMRGIGDGDDSASEDGDSGVAR